MKGAWITRNEIVQILNLSSFRKFEKTLAHELHCKFDRSRKKYFFPYEMMTPAAKQAYKDIVIDEEFDSDDLEVIDDAGPQLDEYTAARIDYTRARTALAKQQIIEQKQEIWDEWNMTYFNIFADAFVKFKNELVALKLSKEQITILTEKLDNALKLMRDGLDAMWQKYIEDKKNEE